MKKLLILILVLFVLSFSTIQVLAVDGVDETPPTEEIPNEPSDFALWVDENIIETVVSAVSMIIFVAVSIVIIYRKLKDFILTSLSLLKKERADTDYIQKSNNDEIKQLKEKVALLTNDLNVANKNLVEATNEINRAYKTFNNLKEEQVKTKEMVRLAFSNDKELVRLGVAEEINKISTKGV